MIVYSPNPGTCPTTYSSYTLTSPQTISSHSWVCAAAKDYNGNVGFSTSPVEFKVDKNAPSISNFKINNDDTYTNSRSVTLTFSVSDSGGSGLYGCRFSNDGTTWSSWQSCSSPKSWTLSSGDGTKTVYMQAKDNAGNIAQASDTIFLDTVPPSCRVSKILESSPYIHVSGTKVWYSNTGSRTGSFAVIVSANDQAPASGIARVEFPYTVSNGGTDTTEPYSWSYSFDSADTYDGSATITVYDNAGNSNTCNFAVNRDVAAPSTTASATLLPGGSAYTFGTWTRNDVHVSLSASDAGTGWGDPAGLDRAEYCYYDTTKGGTCSYKQYSSSFTITCANDDTCAYNLNYYSIDKVSNQESVNTRTILIDKQKPNITVEILPNPAVSDSSVVFRVTCNDTWKYGVGSGCGTTSVTQDLQPYKSCSFSGDTTYECVYDTPSCTYAAYLYTVSSTDNVGNAETITGTLIVKKAGGCECTFDDECYSGLCVDGTCTATTITAPTSPELIAEPSVNVVLGTRSRISLQIKNKNVVPDVMIVHLDVEPKSPWGYWIYFTDHKYDEQYHDLHVYLKPNEERTVHFTVEGNQLTYSTPVEVNVTVKSQNFKLSSTPAQIKINIVESEAEPAYPGVPGLGALEIILIGMIAATYIYLRWVS